MPPSAFEESRPKQASYREILPRLVHETRGTARIIDVREPDEFTGELGHIPFAELVPLETLEMRSKTWRHDEPLVMVCRSGGRSARAAEHLAAQGFTVIMNMVGGMLAWNLAELPTER
jgi:sulfur-carrier protein adenylyltransferase/sulfurtransferase